MSAFSFSALLDPTFLVLSNFQLTSIFGGGSLLLDLEPILALGLFLEHGSQPVACTVLVTLQFGYDQSMNSGMTNVAALCVPGLCCAATHGRFLCH